MARLTLESFAGREVRRVYVAANVREAETVEKLLGGRAIDFAVEMEPFYRPVAGLIPARYMGAVFYVPSGQASYCRRLLEQAGLWRGVVPEEQS
ncbi:MAG: hypothetical protein ACE5JN_16970 [Candidatus Methylomirabilia bacterium]